MFKGQETNQSLGLTEHVVLILIFAEGKRQKQTGEVPK
jgi:hypothetical protein